MNVNVQLDIAGNPFDLDDDVAYRAWREHKLECAPRNIDELIVEIDNPRKLSEAERRAISERVATANMALYSCRRSCDEDKDIPYRLGLQFGLSELDDNMGADDGVTSLKVVEGEWRGGYIPYTNRPIHWHTDGYYNETDRQILGLLLHCVSPAASGGENALLDHELAYIHLRDCNPDFIRVLMASDAMTIPANIENGVEIRAQRTGPVFSVLADGHLHMRYTARTRSIEWHDDATTRAAVAELSAYLQSSPYIFRAIMQPGQGLISNNVLHDRSGFEENEQHRRLLYRLRYYQYIKHPTSGSS